MFGSEGDLHLPLTPQEQNLLMRQCSPGALPKLADMTGNISKSERIRAWKKAVEQQIAALHPLFKEYWAWSWAAAEAFTTTGSR